MFIFMRLLESVKLFLTHPLNKYDKSKVNLLKTILPAFIILNHISNRGFNDCGLHFFGSYGYVVMYLFFAMSGYGLVISYIKNEKYINDFLKKSLSKLFVPYLITLVLFVIYRFVEGIDQIEYFREKGLMMLVPTSWYIYVLSLFYIFYFLVFRYVKSSLAVKVVLVCALVIGYRIAAPYLGVEAWRYERCPAFCLGMMFALLDKYFRTKLMRWHFLVGIGVLLCLPKNNVMSPFIYPAIVFMIMYVIGSFKEIRLVSFMSSISLEMFIVQSLLMDIVIKDMHITSTIPVVVLVLVLDIILAYMVNKLVNRISLFKK